MKTKNIKESIEKEIAPFLENLISRKEVIGIVLLGGLGQRNFLDDFSDIDISVFIENRNKKYFVIPFEFHYRSGNRWLEFNIHQQVIEEEEKKEKWDKGKIEAYSRSKVVYDPTNRVKRLISNKTKFDEKEAFNRLVWIIQQYIWRGHIHSIRSFKRGYPEVAHDLMNQCSELLLEAIYLLNKRYLPHKKWALVYLSDMSKEYASCIIPFKKSMIIKEYTLSDIKRRIKSLDKVYSLVKKETLKKYPNFPKNPYEYYYRNFVQIRAKTPVDSLFSNLIKKQKISQNKQKELYGLLCFNLITSQRFLRESLCSNNIDNLNLKRNKDDTGKFNKHERRKSKN